MRRALGALLDVLNCAHRKPESTAQLEFPAKHKSCNENQKCCSAEKWQERGRKLQPQKLQCKKVAGKGQKPATKVRCKFFVLRRRGAKSALQHSRSPAHLCLPLDRLRWILVYQGTDCDEDHVAPYRACKMHRLPHAAAITHATKRDLLRCR